jgi:hypothetical protein
MLRISVWNGGWPNLRTTQKGMVRLDKAFALIEGHPTLLTLIYRSCTPPAAKRSDVLDFELVGERAFEPPTPWSRTGF